jgi:2-oxo-4-hydroxy-4-carboxy--5-ureidoimidazoline (OHCU) decarboxylase
VAVDAPELRRAFERAPALVDRLTAEAPFGSAEAAVARAEALLAEIAERDRIAVLDAHPRIGADRRALSADSLREQGDDDDAAGLRELARLNDAYEARFGFRFVVFVAGRSKAEIVPVLRARLERTREDELATGIGEFLAIARTRLGPSQGVPPPATPETRS